MESQHQTAIQSLDRINFNEEQLKLIKSQIAPNAKPEELELFLYQSRRTGLNPLARQIYCIHRGGKMTIQTSIDGFRVIAERSGDYGGQDAPEFMYDNDSKLIACRITVYKFRGNQRYPAAVGVAYMSEYNAGGSMWSKMPHTMIAKCAEAQALRKAYPQDLSGLYTSDEMEQAGNEPHVEPQMPKEQQKPAISDTQYAKLIERLKAGDISAASKAFSAFCFTEQQANEVNELCKEQAES